MPVSNRYLPLDHDGHAPRRVCSETLPSRPRSRGGGKKCFAAPFAVAGPPRSAGTPPTSDASTAWTSCSVPAYVSAVTPYPPISQAASMMKSMENASLSLSSSFISLTLSSPAPADGSPVPTDGSISLAPADGFAEFGGDSSGGVGTAPLCAEFCCCHDEETVVLRFEKRTEIDKTSIIPNTSVAVNCFTFPIGDTCSTKIETLQDLSGFELSICLFYVSGGFFVEDRILMTETNNCI